MNPCTLVQFLPFRLIVIIKGTIRQSGKREREEKFDKDKKIILWVIKVFGSCHFSNGHKCSLLSFCCFGRRFLSQWRNLSCINRKRERRWGCEMQLFWNCSLPLMTAVIREHARSKRHFTLSFASSLMSLSSSSFRWMLMQQSPCYALLPSSTSTTAISLHPDGPNKDVRLFCFSLLKASQQPITCQHLLGVRSRRPAGVQAGGEFTSNWVLELNWQTSKCASVHEPLWTLGDVHSAPRWIQGVAAVLSTK